MKVIAYTVCLPTSDPPLPPDLHLRASNLTQHIRLPDPSRDLTSRPPDPSHDPLVTSPHRRLPVPLWRASQRERAVAGGRLHHVLVSGGRPAALRLRDVPAQLPQPSSDLRPLLPRL